MDTSNGLTSIVMLTIVPALIVVCAFSSGSYATSPEWEFIHALQEYPDTRAIEIWESHALNPNFLIPDTDLAGATLLWLAAEKNHWRLVGRMLDHPGLNVNVSPLNRRHRGMTVLWLAALNSQWELVAKILRLQPNAAIRVAPIEGIAKGLSVLTMIERGAPDAMLERLVIHQMLYNGDGVDLITQTRITMRETLPRIKRKIVDLNFLLTAARQFFTQGYDCQPYPAFFGPDLKWMLALTFLREGFPQLGHFTEAAQQQLLLRFLQLHPLPEPTIVQETDEVVLLNAEHEMDQNAFIRRQIVGASPRRLGTGLDDSGS